MGAATIFVEDFSPVETTMAGGKKARSKPAPKEQTADSEDDYQSLKKNGKATFNRDETFNDSEDECIPSQCLVLIYSFRTTGSDHVGWIKIRSQAR
jgi:hypothetical protein